MPDGPAPSPFKPFDPRGGNQEREPEALAARLQEAKQRLDALKNDVEVNPTLDPTAIEEARAAYVQAQTALTQAVTKDLSNLKELSKALQEASKAVKISGDKSYKTQLEALATERDALLRTIEEVGENTQEIIAKILTGGMNRDELRGLEALYQQALEKAGATSSDIKAALLELKNGFDSAESRAAAGDLTAAAEAGRDALKKVFSAADRAQEAINDRITQFAHQAKAIEDVREAQEIETDRQQQEFQSRLESLKKQGRFGRLRAKLLEQGASQTVGEGLQSFGKNKIATTLTGGLNQSASSFTNFSGPNAGKLNSQAITAQALENLMGTAKMGWDAYKSTGRQFGMEHSAGDITSAYKGHKTDINAIALKTGRNEEQVNKVFQDVAANLRVGNRDLIQRKKILNDLTETTIKLSNATGLSEDQVLDLASAYRNNLGKGAVESSKAALDVKAAVDSINVGLKDEFKVTSKDIATIWTALAKDTATYGTSLTKIQGMLQGNLKILKQQELSTEATAMWAKKALDYQMGKGGAGTGESLVAAIVLGGGMPKASAAAVEKLGGKGFQQEVSQSLTATEVGVAGQKRAKASGNKEAEDFWAGYLQLSRADEKNYRDAMDVLLNGNMGVFASPQANGEAIMGAIKNIFNIAGAEKVIGFDYDKWKNDMVAKARKMGGNQGRIMLEAIGVTAEGVQTIADVEAGKKAAPKNAKGEVKGGATAKTEQEVKDQSNKHAAMEAAANPTQALTTALNWLKGSVVLNTAAIIANTLAQTKIGGRVLDKAINKTGAGLSKAGAGLSKKLGLGSTTSAAGKATLGKVAARASAAQGLTGIASGAATAAQASPTTSAVAGKVAGAATAAQASPTTSAVAGKVAGARTFAPQAGVRSTKLVSAATAAKVGTASRLLDKTPPPTGLQKAGKLVRVGGKVVPIASALWDVGSMAREDSATNPFLNAKNRDYGSYITDQSKEIGKDFSEGNLLSGALGTVGLTSAVFKDFTHGAAKVSDQTGLKGLIQKGSDLTGASDVMDAVFTLFEGSDYAGKSRTTYLKDLLAGKTVQAQSMNPFGQNDRPAEAAIDEARKAAGLPQDKNYQGRADVKGGDLVVTIANAPTSLMNLMSTAVKNALTPSGPS